MNNLRLLNENIYEEYKNLNNIEELSSPLLVSSKKYLENIKDNPIMYIGQETNEWVNYNDKTICDIDKIEDSYDSFLIDNYIPKTTYWQFIKEVLSTDYCELYKKILWTNTLLVGKRFNVGNPIVSEELKKISLENLLFLYDYFKPSYVINVSGNRNPYYDITDKFLKEIGIDMSYPTSDNPVIIKDNCVWTYHPSYLRQKKYENDVIDNIKRLIK